MSQGSRSFPWPRPPPPPPRSDDDDDDKSQSVSAVVDNIPSSSSDRSVKSADEWELLSDRVSHTSDPGVWVPKAGSVRSIASVHSHGSTNLSIPFKIQRTHSSSTIDSNDHTLGPAGKGILGVDYTEHVILPTDTLQGICLQYKVSSMRLRQANHFSGNSLLLAPKKLVIPLSKTALRQGFIRAQDTDAKEYKLHAFLAEYPELSLHEAKAYLELADWQLPEAMQSAREDYEWEHAVDKKKKAGEIRINVRPGTAVTFLGAGIQRKVSEDDHDKQQPCRVVTRDEEIPEIASKTVKAKDVYLAAPQHDNFGVELKTLPTRKE